MKKTHVIVSVKDSGRGIKNSDLPTLFQSFQRVEPPVDAVRDGSGLGLYLCRKITDLLGGEIDVKSTYKKGSTFTFKIPSDIETP